MTEYLEEEIDTGDPIVVSAFDELSFWSSRFGALLFRHLELVRGIRILDVGCGSGFPLFELAQVHGPSCHVTGIDVSRPALERAESKRQTYGLTNIRLVRGDGARLPFADGEFDLIVSNLGVNNFEDPRAALGECARVAKPHARIVLTTNLKGHMRELYAVYHQVLSDLGMSAHFDRLTANEDHRATKESLGALVEEAGFRITRVFEESFEMRFLDGASLLRHFLVRVGFLDGWRKIVDPPQEKAVFAALEARMDEVARATGCLRMTVPALYVEGAR